MRSLTTKFGDSAGRIWSVLNAEGCVSKGRILEFAGLEEDVFYSGVGWLAKEGKIYREDVDCFRLGCTNLDGEIGVYAGKVWRVLDIWGDADFVTLKRLSGLGGDGLHAALGWLAREDKICIDAKQRYNLK